MNKATFLLSLLTVFSIHLILISQGGFAGLATLDYKNNGINLQTQTYAEHLPIFINDDSDFTSLGFNGSGTLNDPYTIEGLNITSSTGDLIQINGINSYYIIQNNLLNGLGADISGISIFNSDNGIVRHNVIFNLAQEGISLDQSNFSLIHNNTISDTGFRGIRLMQNSNNNTISQNYVTLAEHGIAIDNSNFNIIEDNTVHSNDFFEIGIAFGNDNILRGNTVFDNSNAGGIYIVESSDRNTIFNNTIFSNSIGIRFEANSNENLISNNSIFNNFAEGIGIYTSNSNIVKYNQMSDNGGTATVIIGNANNLGGSVGNIIRENLIINSINYGVALESEADFNIITENNFALGSTSGHINDNGDSNDVTNNYYDNWGGSAAYQISGNSGNQDTNPSINPHHLTSISLSMRQSESVELSGIADFAWNEVISSFSHLIVYDLYYSVTDGNSWISIAEDLNALFSTFNTESIEDGSRVKFMVEARDELGFVTQDTLPQTFVIANTEHILTEPTIISPETIVLSGAVVIEWAESSDSWASHFLTYSLQYFLKGSSNWNIVALGLVVTQYTWDTTTVIDGEYLLKVVVTDSEGNNAEHVSSLPFVINNGITSIVGGDSDNPTDSSSVTLNYTNINLILLTLAITVVLSRRYAKR